MSPGSARRLRETLSGVASRLREHLPSLLLASVSAGLAFLLAGFIFGPQDAVFAPVAAVVSTGLTAGQRRKRALEITIGVVLGISAADLLSRWLGTGPWQLSLAVLLAMSAAVAFRSSGLLSNQSAVAAVVVMVLVPLLDSSPWVRLGDAVVGGTVAVVLTSILAPDPVHGADLAVGRVLSTYAGVLGELRQALKKRSLRGAEDALAGMESLSGARQDLSDALAASRERIRLARSEVRSERRERMRAVRALESRMELLLSSGRALCRSGANLIRHGGDVDPALTRSLTELEAAVRGLGPWTKGVERHEAVRDAALTSAASASSVYSRSASPAVNVLIGQVRSAAVDLLRITGLTQGSAVAALEEAAGRADEIREDD